MVSTCIWCKKEFKHSPSHKRKYCSWECRNEAYIIRKEIEPCMWCEKPVEQNRARRKKYCSKKCRQQAVGFSEKERQDKRVFVP